MASSFSDRFRGLLDEMLEPESAKQVKQGHDMSREFLVDEYGRVTCFYVRLGNRRFPVYQPGTIMFESSVHETGDLCVLKQGF